MDDELEDARCLTVIEGLSADEAVAALVRGAVRLPGRHEAEAWTFDTDTCDRAWIAVGQRDGWAVVWEDNGWSGADAGALLGLGRTAGSIFWNVNALMRFVLVRDGAVRSFDPLFHGDPQDGPTDDVGEPLAAEAGLDWLDNPRTSGLQLLSHATGVGAIDRTWLDDPDVAYWGRTF